MEKIDSFYLLMKEISQRKPNPVINGYERIVQDLSDRLADAMSDTLYIGIEDVPDQVEIILIRRIPQLKVWTGDLVIDKLFYNRKTYKIVEPIILKGISITVNGHGVGWNVHPRYGFHVVGSGLCLGEYTPPIVVKWEGAVTVADDIRRMLSGINCNSLGNVILPPEYHEWVSIKSHTTSFINTLLEQGKIQEVQQWI